MNETGYLGWAKFVLHLPFSHSLKEKRSAINSIKEKIRNSTGASVAEVGGNDTWQSATITVAIVSNEAAFIENAWNEMLRIIQQRDDVVIVDAEKQWR